jgi:butyryl-CoA dehydrogenase
MQAFGHLVIAWAWLDVLLAVPQGSGQPADEGRVRAARYFFHYELPKISAWLRVVETRDPTCTGMPEEAF